VPPEQRRAAYAEVQQTNALAGNDSNAADYGSLMRRFSEADLQGDPVYQSGLQFGLDEGRRGLNERAIANGGYDSGATLKALTRFGNDYGSTKADQSFNRFQQQNSNVYNRLTGQQGVGLNAAGAVTGAGNLATGQMMDASSEGANARAAGRVGQANAMAGAFGGIGTAIQGYQNSQVFDRIMRERENRGRTGTGYGGYTMGDVNNMFSGV
jgi:hypothetical protein